MNRASSSHGGRFGAALLATLFAVLFGFFAMHGVVAHGVAHSDGSHSAIPGVSEVFDDPSKPGGDVHPARVAAGAAGADDQAPTTPDGHDGFGGEACVDILCLLIALLVMAVRRGRTVRPMFILRRMRSRLILYARPAEPPCLHLLSILRC